MKPLNKIIMLMLMFILGMTFQVNALTEQIESFNGQTNPFISNFTAPSEKTYFLTVPKYGFLNDGKVNFSSEFLELQDRIIFNDSFTNGVATPSDWSIWNVTGVKIFSAKVNDNLNYLNLSSLSTVGYRPMNYFYNGTPFNFSGTSKYNFSVTIDLMPSGASDASTFSILYGNTSLTANKWGDSYNLAPLFTYFQVKLGYSEKRIYFYDYTISNTAESTALLGYVSIATATYPIHVDLIVENDTVNVFYRYVGLSNDVHALTDYIMNSTPTNYFTVGFSNSGHVSLPRPQQFYVRNMSLIDTNLNHNIKVLIYDQYQYNSTSASQKATIKLNKTYIDLLQTNNCNATDSINCLIPITFQADSVGYMNISIYNTSYDYGVQQCTAKYNYPVFNISYFNENTGAAIETSNEYIQTVSEPFIQPLAATFASGYTHSFCSNVNLTKRGLQYDIYGTMNIEAVGFSTKIIENDVFNPYVIETTPVTRLSVYLTESGNSSTVTFTLKDKITKSLLENVQVKMYQYLNGTPSLVTQKLTDVTGIVAFDYITTKQYLINFSKSGYTPLAASFNPITASTYDILLNPTTIQSTSQAFDRVAVTITPQIFNEGSNDYSVRFYSPYNELISYSYSYEYPTGTVSANGSTASGETMPGNFTITNPSAFDVVRLTINYNTALTGSKTFTYNFDINSALGNYTMISNKNKTYGLGLFERLFITTFIVVLFVGLAALFGQLIPGVVMGMILMGVFTYIGFIPIWVILISIFTAFIIMSGRSQ